MKAEDIDKLSEAEAKDMLREFFRSPYIRPYLSLQTQLDKLSLEIEKADIEIGEKTFDSFIKWGEKAVTIADNIMTLRSKIDTSELLKEKRERTKAKEGTPEAMRRNA